jgi:N-acetylneuraminic acid mutarotase
MSKLSLTIIAISLLFVITSCTKLPVEPGTDNDTDTTQAALKGWVQLGNYPGTALRWTFGFSEGNKGYVVGGQYEKTSDMGTANVFQYDSSADKWQKLKDYPGNGMGLMAGFSIDHKTYLGTGYNYSTNLLCNDFWEYHPSNDTWTQKANFPGDKRQGAISFSIGGYGYLLGSLLKTKQDLWKYTPATDQWTQMTDYPGTGIAEMISASVNGRAYVGAGTSTDVVVSDFWEYEPTLDKWTKKADIIEPLYNPVVFTKGTRIYVIGGIGQDLKFRKAVLIYDTATDQCTKAEDFEGQERSAAVGFVIDDTPYFGLGAGSKIAGGAKYPISFNDFWKFNL